MFESGSSFAAPQLSAIAALLFEVALKDFDEARSLDLVYEAIFTAAKQGAQGPQFFGSGFLQADRALEQLRHHQ